MILADGKHDGFSDLAADGITKGVFEKDFAEELVGGGREEAFLEFTVLIGLYPVFAFIVCKLDDKALIGKELGGDFAAGINDGRIDQVAVFHAVEQ